MVQAGSKPIQVAQKADAYAQGAFESLPHPVVVIGPDNQILAANLAAEGFFQSSASSIAKRKLEYFLPFGSPVLTLVNQARDERSSFNEYRIDVSSPRLGKDRLVDVYAAPYIDIEGGVVLQFLQRSVAEKLDRQLTHRGAARTVTGLAAMLAHEIKNPLSGIRGAAQLLEMSANDDDRSLTQLIKDETDRIVQLVDRMEVFSDERPLEAEPVNIHVVLGHVKKLAQTGFAKGINIQELYDPSLPPVLGNRDQLVQVFLNLVKNAAEALKDTDSPSITLSTAYRHGIHLTIPGASKRVALPLELVISDNGPGISDEVRHYIFDPFVTTKTNGSGLGLALVAKIIGDHGGVVECDSTDNGTAFRILLPVFQEDYPETADEREEPTPEGARI